MAMANSPEVLPLQLLQPLDANQQRSEPSPVGGEHRPVVTPDPGVTPADGDERGWRSSRLRIHRNGQVRSIWAVHLPGWQRLGWLLVQPPAAAAAGDERSGLVLPGSDADLASEQESAAEAVDGLLTEATAEPWAPAEPPDPDPLATAATAGVPNFQAMTKAQIINHCLSHYGVSLDGDRTKADLVAAANALAAGEAPAAAEEPVGDNGDAGAADPAEPELPPSQTGTEPGDDLELPDDLL